MPFFGIPPDGRVFLRGFSVMPLSRFSEIEKTQVYAFFLLPAFEEDAARDGARRAALHALDAVGTEMAEITTQLAPGNKQAGVIEVANSERPDGTLAGCAVGIAVFEDEAFFFAQCLPDDGEIGVFIVGVVVAADRIERLIVQAGSKRWREDGVDFAKHVFGGVCEVVFAVLRNPAHAEDESFDFRFAESEGREKKIMAEHEAESGFATNVCTLLAQGVDVAVDGAQADAKFVRECVGSDGMALLPQALQESEQALGAEHEVNCL